MKQVRYIANTANYTKIPGSPFAYWANDIDFNLYKENSLLAQKVETKQGLKSSDDKRFFRFWVEVDFSKIGFNCVLAKWIPLNKGGTSKWYGDNWYVINWEDDGREIKEFAKSLYGSVTRTITSINYYFRECLTWPQISSSPQFRYVPQGFIFNAAGPSMFINPQEILHILGFLNTKLIRRFISYLNPTTNKCVTDMLNIPYVETDNMDISQIVKINIAISKIDWDSFETSWDFKKHPLI